MVISCLFFISFYPKTKQTPIPTDLEKIVITMKRGPCFGTCPVYSLTLYGNGTVIYEGEKFVKVTGVHIYQISQEEIKNLVNEFVRIDYFSLKDRYEASITDLPSTTTSIMIDGKTKSVYNYYGAPNELYQIEKTIDETANLTSLVK